MQDVLFQLVNKRDSGTLVREPLLTIFFASVVSHEFLLAEKWPFCDRIYRHDWRFDSSFFSEMFNRVRNGILNNLVDDIANLF